MIRVLAHGILILLLAIIGCDRRDNAPAPTSRPATTSPTTHIAATMPATRRAPSTLTIDDKRYDFPPARLRVVEKATGLMLVLFSDEPPAAGDQDRTNGFYFEMPLDISDIDDLPSARWRYKLNPESPDDVPDGIFLDGGATQLEPVDLDATFEQATDEIVVHLKGTFADPGSENAEHRFDVTGRLTAAPE